MNQFNQKYIFSNSTSGKDPRLVKFLVKVVLSEVDVLKQISKYCNVVKEEKLL